MVTVLVLQGSIAGKTEDGDYYNMKKTLGKHMR